jgi:hypothetical protein
MKTRKFKVMDSMATHDGAHLRFRGRWVCEAGFHPGMSFTATPVSPGVLELRVAPPASPARTADYLAACASLNRVLA